MQFRLADDQAIVFAFRHLAGLDARTGFCGGTTRAARNDLDRAKTSYRRLARVDGVPLDGDAGWSGGSRSGQDGAQVEACNGEAERCNQT